jgi:hypothetical protein
VVAAAAAARGAGKVLIRVEIMQTCILCHLLASRLLMKLLLNSTACYHRSVAPLLLMLITAALSGLRVTGQSARSTTRI